MKIIIKYLIRISRIIIPVLFLFIIFWLLLRFTPYPALQQFQSRPYSVRYYDRYGILLQITPLADGLRREKSSDIPQHVKDIFVFAEDKRFYSHPGVDIFSVIRALFQNITSGRRISGASTITMQLARIIDDNAHNATQIVTQGATQSITQDAAQSVNRSPRQQTLIQKIGEAINALRLETRLSKNEILELYLNSLPFGFNCEGVTSAARTFFSGELSMLSGAQLFSLAVIPRRPAFYNPLENPQNCASAAMYLQGRFADNRRLSQKWPLLTQIDERDFQFAMESSRRFQYPFELPHLIRLINTQTLSANNSTKGGAADEIYLSIDLALQRYLENAIAGNVSMYYSSRLTNGSAIVIDNETGEILAWVGSADFFNTEAAGQIDGVLTLNQPGSSMKPFLYALALEYGFYPSDVMADIPMTFGGAEIYFPQNFNNRFNGPVLLRASLASSLNIPAVYLLYRLSMRNYTQKLFSLGFDSIEHSVHEAGLGLALGNAPVSLLELVRAFSVFPRDGIFIPLTWMADTVNSEQRTGNGEQRTINREQGARNREQIIENSEQRTDNSQRVFSSDTSRLICSFLSDSSARVLAFGTGRNFRTTFPAIFKTGTANQYQNIVALGATMKYTAGVWMGNFTGETVLDRTGSSIPAAIVRDTLNVLHRANTNLAHGNFAMSGSFGMSGNFGFSGSIDIHDFPQPENWRVGRICAVSGMDPGDACLSVINEYIHPDEDRRECTWHQIINGNIETIYPAEYQAWFTASLRQGSLDFGSRPLEIINPRDGFVYLSGRGIGIDEIHVEVIGGESSILHVTHNGRTFSISRPFSFFLPRETGENILRVQNGYEEKTIIFTVEG